MACVRRQSNLWKWRGLLEAFVSQSKYSLFLFLNELLGNCYSLNKLGSGIGLENLWKLKSGVLGPVLGDLVPAGFIYQSKTNKEKKSIKLDELVNCACTFTQTRTACDHICCMDSGRGVRICSSWSLTILLKIVSKWMYCLTLDTRMRIWDRSLVRHI